VTPRHEAAIAVGSASLAPDVAAVSARPAAPSTCASAQPRIRRAVRARAGSTSGVQGSVQISVQRGSSDASGISVSN